MDIGELHRLGNEVLGALRTRVDDGQWRSAYSLLNHGEEEEFMDLLLALLVVDRTPVGRDEFELVRRLLGFFPVAEYDTDLYRYLTAPDVLDRMTVVDGSS